MTILLSGLVTASMSYQYIHPISVTFCELLWPGNSALLYLFFASLVSAVALGLYMVWNPSEITDDRGRTIATSVIILFASLFYTAVCDAWFRINDDSTKNGDVKIK